jgi:hypothetical protein
MKPWLSGDGRKRQKNELYQSIKQFVTHCSIGKKGFRGLWIGEKIKKRPEMD